MGLAVPLDLTKEKRRLELSIPCRMISRMEVAIPLSIQGIIAKLEVDIFFFSLKVRRRVVTSPSLKLDVIIPPSP